MITRRRRLPGDGPGVEGSPGHMSRHARPTCCRLLPEFRTRQAPLGPLPSVAVFAIFFPTSVNISLLFTVHDFMCFPVFPLFFVLFTYRFLAFELRFPPRRISLRHLFSLPRAASYERSSWKPLLLLKFRTICTVWIMKLCQKDTRECL